MDAGGRATQGAVAEVARSAGEGPRYGNVTAIGPTLTLPSPSGLSMSHICGAGHRRYGPLVFGHGDLRSIV